MRNQKRPVSITRTLAGIAEEGKKGKVLNNWAPSDYGKSENKRDKMFFRRLKNSFKNKVILLGLTIIFLFYPIRRVIADEINKILQWGPVRVEIIQNKMSDTDAEKLISYSENLLDAGLHEEAKTILEDVKIYNANQDILDDVEYTIGKIHYRAGEIYETLKIYKKICYLYPRNDVITEGKLARTLVNIIKKETTAKAGAWWSTWKEKPRPNFTSSTYAFQILKYDYPKQSLAQTTLTEAKDLIDKMLDMDIGKEKFEFILTISDPKSKKTTHDQFWWEYYHILDAQKIFGIHLYRVSETVYGSDWGDIDNFKESYGKLKLLWHYSHANYRNDGSKYCERTWKTKKGATLRKIVSDCLNLDPYSWARPPLKEKVIE